MAQPACVFAVALSATLAGGGVAVAVAPPEPFQGLGQLPYGSGTSHAFAVSYDGSTVVGRVNATNAFRWTVETGLVDLGEGTAWAVSGDGSTVVGDHFDRNGNTQGFR